MKIVWIMKEGILSNTAYTLEYALISSPEGLFLYKYKKYIPTEYPFSMKNTLLTLEYIEPKDQSGDEFEHKPSAGDRDHHQEI